MPSMTKPERQISHGFDDGMRAYLCGSSRERRHLIADARAMLRLTRLAYGIDTKTVGSMLTPPTAQPKTGKNETYTLIFMGSPHTTAGVGNVCPASTEGCRDNCLGPESGHGAIGGKDNETQRCRHARTRLLTDYPFYAAVLIAHEVTVAVRKHRRIGLRLNGVMDIRWELCAPRSLAYLRRQGVAKLYDYTKWSPRLRPSVPEWYHLTLSASERTDPATLREWAAAGYSIAIPFRIPKGEPLPETYHGIPVIDGDLTDDRTLDPAGVIVGLRAKGRTAWRDQSGFIRDLDLLALAA